MKKHTIIYHFDALCGWCYGFTQVMDQLYIKYKDVFNFDVVSGGLFLGDRTGYINKVAPYIKNGAYLQVEERTGVKFGRQFLEESLQNNTMYLDSTYPAVALCIVKEKHSSKKMEYASLLLKTFYRDGASTNNLDVYNKGLTELEIEIENFTQLITSKKYLEMALADFKYNAAQNIAGFPSLKLKQTEKTITLSNGFVSFEELDKKISKFA